VTASSMESVALYSFQATEKDELPFQKGDILKVRGAGGSPAMGGHQPRRGLDAAALGDGVGTWHGVTPALSLHLALLPLWGFLWGIRSHPGGFWGAEQHPQQRWVPLVCATSHISREDPAGTRHVPRSPQHRDGLSDATLASQKTFRGAQNIPRGLKPCDGGEGTCTLPRCLATRPSLRG